MTAKTRQKLILGAVLAATALSMLVVPAYTAFLRARLARGMPSEWEHVTNNGPFTYVSPLIVTTRNHEEGLYAEKVRQIVLHGLPYDPHTGDRSLKSWLFDSMMFLPLAPFAFLCGGSVQYGWILAHAVLAALWVWLFFLVFEHYSGDFRSSILCAVTAFVFIDFIYSLIVQLLPRLLFPPMWDPHDLANVFFLLLARPFGQILWMRLPSPAMTFLWLYAVLAWVYRLSFQPRRTLSSAAAGFAAGLLCLAHFYEWTFTVGSIVLFFLLSLRERYPKPSRWNLGAAAGTSAAVSVLYYLTASRLTAGVMGDVILRVGKVGVFFAWESLLPLICALLFWLRSGRLRDPRRRLWKFAAVQMAAVFLLENLSFFLRYDLQWTHYDGMYLITTALMGFCFLLESRRLRERAAPAAYVCTAFILAFAFVRNKGFAQKHFKVFGTPQHVEQAANWMNGHVPSQSLFFTLSGVLTEFLPLKTDVRYPVGNGSPSYGSPIPTDANLRGLARILRTVEADAPLFVEKRLRGHWRYDALKQNATYHTGDLAWGYAERAAWAYFLFNTGAGRVESEGYDERVLRYADELPPFEPPFYFWLHKGDEEFLTRPLEELGGAPVYRNPDVALYYFPRR